MRLNQDFDDKKKKLNIDDIDATKNKKHNINNTHNINTSALIKTKQKTLLPTLKEEQRYIVYNIIYAPNKNQDINNNFNQYIKAKDIDFKDIHEAIISECKRLFGIFDGSKAGIISVKYAGIKNKGIIRINSHYVDKLKVALGLIKSLKITDSKTKNQLIIENIIIDCEYVSGLLNKAEKIMKS